MSYKSNLTNNGILKSNYKLVWSEFFNESHLDTNKWNIEIRDPGWVNNELQAYTDKQDNIYIQKNNLVIQGIKENHGKAEYTSGRINTSEKSSWKYGRFEIRAKIPKQKGLWPAIWLLSETILIDGWPTILAILDNRVTLFSSSGCITLFKLGFFGSLKLSLIILWNSLFI